jgi:hypothetical protein
MTAKGILARDMAIRAPMMEVFGVIPILEIICMQMTAESAETRRLKMSVSFSRAFTCCLFSVLSISFIPSPRFA